MKWINGGEKTKSMVGQKWKFGQRASKCLRADCLNSGGKLAAWGPLWVGSVCWSSVWACLHADSRQQERKGEADRRQGGRDTQEDETRSSPLRREWNAHGGRRRLRRGRKSQVVWGRDEEAQRSQKKSLSLTERHRWAGRQGKRVTEGGREGKLSLPRPPSSSSSAALAVACSGEERLLKPSPRLHVWTQSLPLPC